MRADRPRDPELPDEITARSLHGSARNELKTLSAENADAVARHLAAASTYIDVDPELAHAHAMAASRRAGRVGVVRETVGITAYATGDFALALRELRTYRRITGSDEQIALIVDSERGIGRPEKALEEGRAVDRSKLDASTRVELAIAMSGARLDLGQTESALAELDIPELNPDVAYSYSAGLFAARAAVLEDLGRAEEAAEWMRRAEVAAEATATDDSDELIVVDESEDEELVRELEAQERAAKEAEREAAYAAEEAMFLEAEAAQAAEQAAQQGSAVTDEAASDDADSIDEEAAELAESGDDEASEPADSDDNDASANKSKKSKKAEKADNHDDNDKKKSKKSKKDKDKKSKKSDAEKKAKKKAKKAAKAAEVAAVEAAED
ncbi:hypothetical protein GCM10009860_23570 [Microbacterium mitrae]|uniref:hypothetical protein n=1 Tax=Microbacterium mitrae TaxID=664640 RepID=UPI0031E1978D